MLYMGMQAHKHLLEVEAVAQGEMSTTSNFILTYECLQMYSQHTY